MALVKVKPTSAGRRGLVKVVNDKLHKGKPFAGLLEKKTRSSGRQPDRTLDTPRLSERLRLLSGRTRPLSSLSTLARRK